MRVSSVFSVILVLSCALLGTPIAAAQDPPVPDQPSGEETERTIFEHLQIDLLDLEQMGREIQSRLVGEPLRLTLRDCVARALDSNPDILVTSFDPSIAEAGLFSSRAQARLFS